MTETTAAIFVNAEGAGKSTIASIIKGEPTFRFAFGPAAVTTTIQSTVWEDNIILVDTPGLKNGLSYAKDEQILSQITIGIETIATNQVLCSVFNVNGGGRLRRSDVDTTAKIQDAYDFTGDSTIAIVNCIDAIYATPQFQEEYKADLCASLPKA
jgi:GTPase Era involved in 16S rRNA processing